MPDFTFNSPDGKAYTVSGPDGATKEQAFQILQGQISSGTAKADASSGEEKPSAVSTEQAPAAPKAKPTAKQALTELLHPPKPPEEGKSPLDQTIGSAAKAVGSSAVFGGVLGAVSPELLSVAAAGSMLIPEVGPEISAALRGLAVAAKASRLGAAATGALSGATSEIAGQGAEAAGAGPAVANSARLAGGLVSPEGIAAATGIAKPAKLLYGALQKAVGTDTTPAAVQKAQKILRGVEDAGMPQHTLHATLQAGAEADIKSAHEAGDKVLADARTRADAVASDDSRAATRILDEGTRVSDSIRSEAVKRAGKLNSLSQGRMQTSERVLQQAEPALREVGTPAELSDIGNNIRSAVTTAQDTALAARSKAYTDLKQQRDAVVSSKQQAGQTIDQLPEMKDLKTHIDSKTLGTKAGQTVANGLAPVTDQGTLRAYQNVRDAINNRRVQTGVGEDGKPTFQTFKTSFDALDQVRRKLGDVVANRDVEGYSTIGHSIAKDLYGRISRVQEAYAGPVQRELQTGYSDDSIGLRKFGTGAGSKTTALDRVDPERFAADPSSLPKEFFRSQQSVRDLTELTGNPGLTQTAARSYMAQSIRGMSSKQVAAWAQKNSDWMREVPGLQRSAEAYASRLGKIEETAGKASAKAQGWKDQARAVVPEAEKVATKESAESIGRASKMAEGSVATQNRILQDGEKSAAEASKEAAAPAQGLANVLQSGEKPEAIRSLLLTGKPEQTRLAAQIASKTPEGKKDLENSVRQITSGMTESTLRRSWEDRLRPMLQDGKMLSPERFKALETDVQRVLSAHGGKTRLSLVQRHIIAAIGATGADYSSALPRQQ